METRSLENHRLATYLAALGLPPKGTWGFRRLSYVAVFERPQLKIANANYKVALGRLQIVEQIPNPSLGVSTAYNETVPLPSPWTVGPLFSFLIENFFRRDALIGAARKNVAAAREVINDVAWHERRRVYTALLDLWATRRIVTLDRREASLEHSIARAVEERYHVGAASATALTTAKLNAEQTAFQQHQAQLKARLAMVHLAKVVGLPCPALRSAKISFAIFRELRAPRDITAAERTALVDRPEVREALASYRSAQDRLKAATKGLVSAVNVAPGYTDNQQTNNYSLSASATAPLFNQHTGQIAVARAERLRAALHLKSVQESVLGQIEHARADWRKSRAIVATSRRAVHAAQHELAASRQAYRAGVIGNVRLLGVRLQALSASIDLLHAQKEQYGAIGDLMSALHAKLWETDSEN